MEKLPYMVVKRVLSKVELKDTKGLPDSMIIPTFFLLVLLAWILRKKYRWLALAHPGLWFVAAWSIALCCYYLAIWIGATQIYDADALNQLYTFIIVTALGFLFIVITDPPPKKQTPPSMKQGLRAPGDRDLLLGLFGITSLVGSILHWFLFSINFASMEARRQVSILITPAITARLIYFYVLAYPAALAAGWRIAAHIASGTKLKKLTLLLTIPPLLSGILWSIGTGGRQSLGIILLHYACGACLGWTFNAKVHLRLERQKVIQAIKIMLITTAAFALFVSITGKMRASFQNTQATIFDAHPVLGPFAQFIEYMEISIAAYQVRVNWIDELGYEPGRQTFGVLDSLWIGKLLGWVERSREADFALAAYKAAQGYKFTVATASSYFDLQADFGYGGGLIITCLLVILSHHIFTQWHKNPRRLFITSLIPICTTLMFWVYSHQFSFLKYEYLKWMLLSFILWDIATYALLSAKIIITKEFISALRDNSYLRKSPKLPTRISD